MRPGSAWLSVAAALAACGDAAVARADETVDKLACVRSAEAAQKLRLQGRLVEARGQLAVCARDGCPALVREDCRQWLVDIDGTVPSVVVIAKNSRGRDLDGVRVRVDGASTTSLADGRPLLVDPGEHTFEYEAADGKKVHEKIIVRAGDKNRALTVTFPSPPVPAPPRPPPVAVVAPVQTQINPVAWVFYGVSGLAFGGFAYLGISANSDASDLRARCAPRCAPKDVQTVRTQLLLADISFGVSILAAGAATWLVLMPDRVGGGTLKVDAMPGGGSVTWKRSF